MSTWNNGVRRWKTNKRKAMNSKTMNSKTMNSKTINITKKTLETVSNQKYKNESFLVIKVGNDEHRASKKDIQDMILQISDGIINDKSNIIVTHHAIEFIVLPRKLFNNEMKCITND